MLCSRKGKRVAFVAHRVHTTLKGEGRVKGHFKSLCSVEPASEDYTEHWLLKFLKGDWTWKKICLAGLSHWKSCKCEKHLSWIFPFYPSMGENASVPLHFTAAVKMLPFLEFLSHFRLLQAVGRRKHCSCRTAVQKALVCLRFSPAGAVSVETEIWPG